MIYMFTEEWCVLIGFYAIILNGSAGCFSIRIADAEVLRRSKPMDGAVYLFRQGNPWHICPV